MDKVNQPEGQIPYRKHSTGDLQSRLKTRKVLGVGETDNGDVHRSKISQVLGHNEHLYVKYPKFYSVWHTFVAIMCLIFGIMNLCSWGPGAADKIAVRTEAALQMREEYNQMYGATLIGFALLMFNISGKTDKKLARSLMAAIATAQCLHIAVLFASVLHRKAWTDKIKFHIGVCLILTVGSIYYFWAIGSSTAGVRRVPSYSELDDLAYEHTCEELFNTEECPGCMRMYGPTTPESKKDD